MSLSGPTLAIDNVILPPKPSLSKLGLLLFHITPGQQAMVMLERSTLPNATEYKLPQVDLLDPTDPDEPQYMGDLGRQAIQRLFGIMPESLEYWNSLRKPIRTHIPELEARRKRFEQNYTDTYWIAFRYHGLLEQPATDAKNSWYEAGLAHELVHPFRRPTTTTVLGMLPNPAALPAHH